jgi:hypothetical protein
MTPVMPVGVVGPWRRLPWGCGPAAARDIEQTRRLIEQIQAEMAEAG